MKWKNITKKILTLVFFVSLIILSSYQVYSTTVNYIAQGNFQLNLYQNKAIQIQSNDKYVEIELTSPYLINTTSGYMYLLQTKGLFKFTSNTNGTIEITTNIDKVKTQVNDEVITILDNGIINFDTSDIVTISWSIGEAYINFYIGLIGIGLFCANPVLSYKLSDNAKDKFKFLFLLMAIGIVSLALAFQFIYSGI